MYDVTRPCRKLRPAPAEVVARLLADFDCLDHALDESTGLYQSILVDRADPTLVVCQDEVAEDQFEYWIVDQVEEVRS